MTVSLATRRRRLIVAATAVVLAIGGVFGGLAATHTAPFSTTALPSRSASTWPFDWDAVWNMPIASTATYAPATLTADGFYEDGGTQDENSTDPSFPLKPCTNCRLTNGSTGTVQVYSDPAMSGDGQWNSCATFLAPDGNLYAGNTLDMAVGGDPMFGGVSDVTWAPTPIEGTVVDPLGCEGGSNLSGLGGDITLADLTQSGPITHALKFGIDCYTGCSHTSDSPGGADEGGGYRWPATTADPQSGGNDYDGTNTNVVEGALLALPPSINPDSFSNPTVQRIATALQDYGGYVSNTTATGVYDFDYLATNYNAATALESDVCTTGCGSPSSNKSVFSSQLDQLLGDLSAVTNNTPSTPGGGAVGADRYAPYAPEFADGTDVPPAVTVVCPQGPGTCSTTGPTGPTGSTTSTTLAPTTTTQSPTTTTLAPTTTTTLAPTTTTTLAPTTTTTTLVPPTCSQDYASAQLELSTLQNYLSGLLTRFTAHDAAVAKDFRQALSNTVGAIENFETSNPASC